MFVTTLNFSQVLERFYEENKYDFLLLFVSSFDGKDKEILERIVDNANRIDRITGERICFFYFIQERFDSMNEKITRWVRNLSDKQSLYGEGVNVTMETSDDICNHFGILRSYLPAFILVPKDRREEAQVISVKDYQDLESLLSPLNTLNSYLFDRRKIISDYEYKKQTLLEDNPELHVEDIEGSVEYPVQRLLEIKDLAINGLNITLNSQEGEWLVEQVENASGYSNAVLKIWDLVRTRGVRISSIVECIRKEIYERGFDVFISCKSQDYAQARGVYEYLKTNGFKPFLADQTLKEIGVDQYTAVIGEVINVCKNMVVFATHVDYLNTPYVHAEWHAFINDMNTGYKPNACLVNVLSPDIDIHSLPAWLRDKQCFTIENYEEGLLDYLNNGHSVIVQELKETIEDTYLSITNRLYHLKSSHKRHMFDDYLRKIKQEKDRMFRILETFNHDSDVLERFQRRVKFDLSEWENECLRLIIDIEKDKLFELENKQCYHRHQRTKSARDLMETEHYKLSEREKADSSDKAIEVFYNINYSDFESKLDKKIKEKQECVKKPSVSYNLLCTFISNAFHGKSESLFRGLFGRKTYDVFSSIFAPAEVKPNSHMLVQVYLHLLEETEKVKSLAQESQKDAQRRDYIPLQCKLKKGDKVDVLLNVYGESLLMSDKKSMVWQGSFTKCTFDYRVPKDINVDELSCKAILAVGGVPVGEMNFITQIVVDKPRNLNTEIKAHNYSKVFISYAHKDEQAVKFLAKGLEVMKVDHFFDRKYLKAGDIFPQVIEDYINSADLFVLCWSENASQSEYVKKEYTQALGRVNPQVKSQNDASISIYPISIEPRAELPAEMKNYYHFGEV